MMDDQGLARLQCRLLVFCVVFQAVFAAAPGLDLAFSALFIGSGHLFDTHLTAHALRISAGLRSIMELLAFAITLTAISLLIRALRAPEGAARAAGLRDPWLRVWAYLAVNLVLVPGVIVNLLLKAHSGRARPVDIVEFGGTQSFTPMGQLAQQCARNCSFSSGEAALAAALVFPALAVLWPHLPPRRRRATLVTGGALVLGVALFRVVPGRHFLSDVLASVLISAFCALLLYRMMGLAQARLSFTPQRLRAEIAVLLARAGALARPVPLAARRVRALLAPPRAEPDE